MSQHKIVIFGAGGVGKTALTIQFIQNVFIEEYDPTIEDVYRKQVTIDNEACILDILDTAGEEEYSAMRDQYVRTGEGFIIVFSLTSKRSFDEVVQQVNSVRKVKGKDTPIIMIGNKCDLNLLKQVNTEDINELCEQLGCEYIETSAKENINVFEAFSNIVMQLRNSRNSLKTTSHSRGK